MVALVLGLVACLVPSLALFFWLRSRKSDDGEYRALCSKALKYGMLSSLPVLVLDLVVVLSTNALGWGADNPLARDAITAFVVAAFVEEAVKYYFLFRLMKRVAYPFSWLDVIVLMTIIGAGFGIFESIPVALQSSPAQAVVRGITMGHVSYGFIMGYFTGRALYTGKKLNYVLAFLVPFLLHGWYDFGLKESFGALGDWTAFVSVNLALLDVILVIVLIVFVRKHREDAKYTQPLVVPWRTGSDEAAMLEDGEPAKGAAVQRVEDAADSVCSDVELTVDVDL